MSIVDATGGLLGFAALIVWLKKRPWFLKTAGYLVPLFQSLPPLGAGWAWMTFPLILYLAAMLYSLPIALPNAVYALFYPAWDLLLERTLVISGLLLFSFSVAYLRMKRKEGLVTSGPYRLVRHPQYLGMALSTIGFTSWSVSILVSTFGTGFLTPRETIGVWFAQLLAYILLAYIEELYLSREYAGPFENYKSKAPFFIPFIKTGRRKLEIAVSILVPTLLLLSLIVGHSPFLVWV